MSWVDNREYYEKMARGIDVSMRLFVKDFWFWQVVGWLLSIISFGLFNRRVFLADYGTTIGPWVFIPRGWGSISMEFLIHEGEHVKQARRCGFGVSVWLGLPIFAILYGVIVFPVWGAWFRYYFELKADEMAVRFMVMSGQVDRAKYGVARRIEEVSGWGYLKPLPRYFVERGYNKMLENVMVAHGV
jgi:hypothetical protein